MSTATISGSLGAIAALDNEAFSDIETNAAFATGTGFTLSNLLNGDPGFVPTTQTNTTIDGTDAGIGAQIILTGTNLLASNGNVSRVQIIAPTVTVDLSVSMGFTLADGIRSGTATSYDVTYNDGSRVVNQGTFSLSAGGVISGNVTKQTVTTAAGFIAEFTGNFNPNTHTGKLTKIYFDDGAGNSITFTGQFVASAFFTTIDNVDDFGEVIEFGLSFADVITGTGGIDELTGFAGNDRLVGLGGNDTLDGGTGNDSLVGGLGDDIYIVDSATDKAIETAGQGTDTVRSTSLNYTLGLNVENLALLGTANINGTGNAAVNTLTGNSGNNTLSGGAGADTMVGDTGDDTFIIENALDVAMEDVGEGSDIVVLTGNNAGAVVTIDMDDYANIEGATVTGTGLYNIQGNALDNVLTGNASVNTLTGAAGDDTLNGGAGADIMDGGADDDTYHIDTLADQIVDSGGEDTVVYRLTTPTTYTLAADMENLVLFGTAALHGVGNASVNSLTGNAGANSLNGLAGADFMAGAGGNDIYIVDDSGDTVTEAANEGIDTVRSSATFTLGANVEALLLTGAANADATGNATANTITGNTGDNAIDGGGGIDKLAGGAGNDTYTVDVLAGPAISKLEDTVTEAANAGTDTLVLRTGGLLATPNPTTFTLAANVENFDASGTQTNLFNLTGNALANILTGNDGNNTLNGGAGADALNGGDGDDTLVVDNAGDATTGGLGVDTVRSSLSFDLTSDLSSEHLVLTGNASINGTGHAGDNQITGNTYGNTLDGGAGADTLSGMNGADRLIGGLDNDILDGGAGIDSLDGGGGQDTFIFQGIHANSAANADLITGFTAGAGGDILDISDILVGYGGGSLAGFVQLTTVGGDTVISVDKNGPAPGGVFYKIATLVGVTGLDLATMQADGNITGT